MRRAVVTVCGVLVLALVAIGLTEATLALGRTNRTADDVLLRPLGLSSSPTPSPSPTSTPTATQAATPVATPAPVPTPTPVAGPRATTNAFVHMRAGKSTSSAILIDLNGGTVVALLPDADSQWQQVRYNGLVGYIFKAYLAY